MTIPRLDSLARDGRLGVGIPVARGGSGGDLADLFEIIVHTAQASPAAARICAVQRHFAEVLLASENIGLAEYRLAYILDGDISGACSATWPERALAPLEVSEAKSGFLASGTLHAVPNVGTGWYLVTALLKKDAFQPASLVLLSSEQGGMIRLPALASSGQGNDNHAEVEVRGVFLRGDEIVQEDAARIAPRLQRFAQFLRCAIVAGTARLAMQSMEAEPRRQAQAMLTRTVNDLLRDVASSNRLPDAVNLRIACTQLERLHGALAEPHDHPACGPSLTMKRWSV